MKYVTEYRFSFVFYFFVFDCSDQTVYSFIYIIVVSCRIYSIHVSQGSSFILQLTHGFGQLNRKLALRTESRGISTDNADAMICIDMHVYIHVCK